MMVSHPFFFGPAERPLFGWYHGPAGPVRQAVLLCPALGLDGTRAHRSYRHLAERLARAGSAVLRFDWHGTGDSSGDDHEPDRVATWLGDLGLAIDELKRRSGAARLALVGTRAAAALVGHVASQRDDIDAVVLWIPVMTGATWVAEMAKLHKLYLRIVPQADTPEPGGEELLGSFASNATIADLARIDLLALGRRPAQWVLVVDDGPLRGGEQLRDRLRALGAEVEWSRHSGQKFLLTVPHKATLPEESIDAMVAWLAKLPAGAPAATVAGVIAETPFDERPIRFGADGSRFGILTAPSTPPPAGRPAVLVLNAGAVNRTGTHRLSVRMARRWAALGFTVFRIDLSGIGDTPAAEGTRESLVYPPDGYVDIDLAIDVLAAETAASRFIIVGLCSGADFAFQLARRDPRLVGAVMMNPRTFLELDLGRVESATPLACVPYSPASEEAERVAAGMGEISSRGLDALLVVSRPDPGIDFVDRHATAAMREAETHPRFRRVDIPGTDHTFTTLASQRTVIEVVTNEFMLRHL
ncbi:MAG TPA: alpha/beta hydrolase [Polyangia bacterium]|jgi:alpha-beta hydrolase superfamily lysophospholipase